MTSIELNLDAIVNIPRDNMDPDALQEVADKLADSVRDETPELSTPQTADSNAAEPGEMRGSIEVTDAGEEHPGGKRVVAKDGRFRWVEFGTGMRENKAGAERGEMPAFAPFRKAAESFDEGRYEPGG